VHRDRSRRGGDSDIAVRIDGGLVAAFDRDRMREGLAPGAAMMSYSSADGIP